MAALRARHATALRSYVLELTEGDRRAADRVLEDFWREWDPRADSADVVPREEVFAAVRRPAWAARGRLGLDATDAAEHAAAEADARSLAEKLAARFQQLTTKQQEALRLRLRHGFSAEEVATITEVSGGGVAQLLHTALARLHGQAGVSVRAMDLALAGASVAELAGASPEERSEVVDLRATLEALRPLLAGGAGALRPRAPRGKRRGWLVLAAFVIVVAILAAAAWQWRKPAAVEARDSVSIRAGQKEVIAGSRADTDSARNSLGHTNTGGGGGSARLSASKPSQTATSAPVGRAASATPVQVRAGQVATPAVATDPAPRAARTESSRPAAGDLEARVPSGGPAAVGRGQRGERAMLDAPAAQGRGETSERETPPQAPKEARASAAAETVAATRLPERTSAESPARSAEPATAPVRRAAEEKRALSERSTPRAPGEVLWPEKASAPSVLGFAPLRAALEAARWPQRQDVSVAAWLETVPPAEEPPPAAGELFEAQVESAASPWQPGRQFVRVSARAREQPTKVRAPATVIFLLDVSSSMAAPNRLPLVQEAVGSFLRRLQPEDRVGLVTYAGESRVRRVPAPLGSGAELRGAVSALTAEGRTNGGAGLREAFALAESAGRMTGERVVILCTDGEFNMGETSEEQLGALIDERRASGVRLAIFGFGRAEAIDARLAALAARARGGSGYVNTRAEAELALAQQLDSLFAPAAEQVELAVEFDPAQVARARAIDEAELRAVADGATWQVARRTRVLPGEMLTGLFEVEPVPGRRPDAQAVRVHLQAEAVSPTPTPASGARRWQRTWTGALSDRPLAEGNVDFRFAAAAGAFGEVLRAGPAAAGKLDDIEHWVAGALGSDVGGYRAELLAMIAQFRRMDGR